MNTTQNSNVGTEKVIVCVVSAKMFSISLQAIGKVNTQVLYHYLYDNMYEPKWAC